MTHLPSFNALRAFEAVARLGSVALASSELSVSPGAVSRQLKELESCLGVAVLERDGRGVRLTSDGKCLQDGLHPAFTMISNSVHSTRRNLGRKRLKLATVPLFAAFWMIPRLHRFVRAEPKVDIAVSDRFEQTGDGACRADAVIEWGSFECSDDVIAERLTSETVFPVCSPAARPSDGLAGATLLHRQDFPSRYDFPNWPAFLAAVGLDEPDGLGSRSGPGISGGLVQGAAREGMGVALVAGTIAYDDLASGRLVRPIPQSMKTEHGYWLLIRRTVSERSDIKAFRDWLREEIAASVGRPCPENRVPVTDPAIRAVV
ncbi:MAG: LysR substrate-binding domain-containing protein [Rhodospirillales bacterium]|nr:LysR substrate-binding domain-containing protein [Rhodospirillales bacterium]